MNAEKIRPLPQAKALKVAAAVTIGIASLLFADTAFATGSYYTQSFYKTDCGYAFNACNTKQRDEVTAHYEAGEISYEQYAYETSQNQDACMAANTKCQNVPKADPNSPTKFDFIFYAIYPY